MKRFWNKVAKGPGCWYWQGAGGAYGKVRLDGRSVSAHRLAWQLKRGPIPAGLHVLHRCDNPRCVRPSHLFLGDHSDNMKDAARKGRVKPPHKFGESHHKAKVTAREVRAIRASAATISALANRYRLSRGAICHIRARRSWNHVGTLKHKTRRAA